MWEGGKSQPLFLGTLGAHSIPLWDRHAVMIISALRKLVV